MPDEVVELVAPAAGMVVVDGTFGAGGHARLIAPTLGEHGLYVGVDRDPSAAARFEAFAAEVAPTPTRFVHATYPDAFTQLRDEGLSADAVILDVGVSSMQLDQPERGFSYAHDAPLDMRMDPSTGTSAAQLVADLDERALERVLRTGSSRSEREGRSPARASSSTSSSRASRPRPGTHPAGTRHGARSRRCASPSTTSSACSTAAWMPRSKW
jgi:16S rRNA (cytosine1402-N4)-methyltransferase